MVKFQRWDGSSFRQVTPFIAGDRDLVRKMVEESAAKYAKEKKITPRDCAKEGRPRPPQPSSFPGRRHPDPRNVACRDHPEPRADCREGAVNATSCQGEYQHG